ncbi:MAG: TraB/GumN family protein [Pseudomonadota bacterium]
MKRVGLTPGIGKGAAVALLAVFLLAGTAEAQRYRYRPPAAPVAAPAPALRYRELPADDRIAPDGYALDDLVEEAPAPATRAALAARVAALVPRQEYVPRPALWRIRAERPGGADTTIWLFGTVHILPPGFRWRSPTVEAVTRQADALLVEAVDDPAERNPFAARGTALSPLAARVSPSHRGKLAALVATLPSEAAATLDTLPTWIAAVAVSVVRDIRAGEVPGPGADDWFEQAFRTAGKPVAAIEDGARVMASANAIPEAEARAMLDAALDAPAVDREAARAPLHAWAQGQVGPGSPIVVALPSRSLTTALLDRRNAAWAASLKARLARPGRTLFVAGAGHFIGAGSVLERLDALGVRVERVE